LTKGFWLACEDVGDHTPCGGASRKPTIGNGRWAYMVWSGRRDRLQHCNVRQGELAMQPRNSDILNVKLYAGP
jgi:hypothetical protein